MLAEAFNTKLDWFAELIAEGKTPREAAEAMRLNSPAAVGNAYMQRLRKIMGPQAR